MDIGTQVLIARRKKKMTQKEVAEKVGIYPEAISQIETGKNYPRVNTIKKLAEVLETVFIIGGEE